MITFFQSMRIHYVGFSITDEITKSSHKKRTKHMIAENALPSWKLGRIFFNIIGVFGCLLYLVLVNAFLVVMRQNPDAHASLLTELFFILQYVVFASGLPPLFLAVYFFFFKKAKRDQLVGAAWVGFFFIVHFYVVAAMAHGSAWIYVPLMVIELLGALTVIQRHKRQADLLEGEAS